MKTKHLLLVFLAFLPFSIFSQDGSPDISFGNNGIVETDIDGDWDFAWEIAQQEDGKLLVGGEGGFENNLYKILARYNIDGSLDSTFGNNGFVFSDFYGFQIIKIQPQNKILTGIRYGGSMGGFELTRFFENGDLDTSFGTNGELSLTSTTESYKSLQLLNDGKFLIAGETGNSPSELKITRFLQNGEIDTSFGTIGSVTNLVGNENNFSGTIETTDTNHLFVLCKTTSNNSIQYFLLKFLPSGNLDTSFGEEGLADIPGDETSCSFKLTTNEKIIIRCSGEDSEYFLRLLPNGMLDTTFGVNGSFNYVFAFNRYLVQDNQRILLFGNYQDPFEGGGPLAMRRYLENGNIDTDFNFNQNYSELNNSKAIFQNDGKIIVVGSTMWYNGSQDFLLLRYKNNNPLGIEDSQLKTLSVYPNPSNGIFKLQHDYFDTETPYQISDITGKIIQTGNLSGEQTAVNLSNVKTGVYYFTVSGKTMKLIKN